MAWRSIVERVADLLPPTPEGAGRASLPVRTVVGMLHLKYAYNLSNDQILERWLESPTMQSFTGEVYFQDELPCDWSSLTRWRNRLDEAGAEELLAQTIEAAKTLKAIRPRELRLVFIDTTVQEKNVAHATAQLAVCWRWPGQSLLSVPSRPTSSGARAMPGPARDSIVRPGDMPTPGSTSACAA